MIHSFYLYFQRILHCSALSALLARCAYLLLLCRFRLEAVRTKEQIVRLPHEEAESRVSAACPDRQGSAEAHPAEPDPAMDLSIIVPVYNYAGLIRANIESILNQKTKYRFELILVDDGSTDGADGIVRSYASDPRVKAIFQRNKGIGGARNTGLDASRGRYVMFVDCDDLVDDDLVELLMDKASGDDCDLVMCGHNLVKQRGGETLSVLPNVYPPYNLLGYSGKAKLLNYPGLPWGKVYRRELFDRVRFFEGYWYEVSTQFYDEEDEAYLPKTAYEYRWYENNYSHTQGKKSDPRAAEFYWLMKRILQSYDALGAGKDERYYTVLLTNLSYYLYHATSGLDLALQEALFSLACELLEEYGSEPCPLPYMLRVAEKAMRRRDFALWKLSCRYQ